MTDMRATERLLEVIKELADDTYRRAPSLEVARSNAKEIAHAIRELRRRGDTLVRRDDLMRVLEHVASFTATKEETPALRASHDRLEIALGGKLR